MVLKSLATFVLSAGRENKMVKTKKKKHTTFGDLARAEKMGYISLDNLKKKKSKGGKK